MRYRTWFILPALFLALVLSTVLLMPQGGNAGAQGPDETDDKAGLALQDALDVGPPAYIIAESPDTETTVLSEERDGASALAGGFTYQGRLVDGGRSAEGTYDLRFRLYNAQEGGSPIGSIDLHEDVAVSDGLFTVVLDFGSSVFTGDDRYLEIGVRPGASTDTFVILTPRRPVTPTPYATYAANADRLDGYSSGAFALANHDHDSRYYRKRQGTQFTSSVNPGQTRSYFTFNWPTDEIVYWSVHPTTVDGRVDWSVDIKLGDNDRFTYYITVTNRGSSVTSFAAKYIRFR